MAESVATWGKGTLLQRSTDGVTYVTIPEVTSDIAIDSPEAEKIDVSHHESPDDTKESISGWKDTGPVSITVNFLPTNAVHITLMQDYTAGTIQYWKVILTDSSNTYGTFRGYVSKFTVNGPLNSATKADFTVQRTGAITWSNV